MFRSVQANHAKGIDEPESNSEGQNNIGLKIPPVCMCERASFKIHIRKLPIQLREFWIESLRGSNKTAALLSHKFGN